jgi:cytochrome c oxidase subunit 4
MENHAKKQEENGHETHISSYKDHFSTLAALLLLTIITVTTSVFGANLKSLSVFTALTIATVKVVVVAYYFMHLKYEKRLYTWLVMLVVVLFLSFLILTSIEYLNR